MEKSQITLTFESKEDADLFVAKFLHCGGEQATGFTVVKGKSSYDDNKKLLHLASLPDNK